MSKWSHFANAKHIDRIIAHVKANPKAWNAVQAERYPAWNAAWDAANSAMARRARYSAYDAARFAVHAAVRDAAKWVAYDAASFAILALVAWDYAGGLMDLPAEQVKVLAILGDQAAILMYLAIVAMETTQELA